MWVRFTETFIFVPKADKRCAVVYKKKWTGSVRRECGERAIAQGKAVEVDTPRRSK